MTIDVFTVGGQSNAKGRGDESQSPTPPAGSAKEYLWDGSIVDLSDPVEASKRDPAGEAQTGSAWPSFADRFVSQTDRDICIVGTARDSAAQAVEADSGDGHWDTGSTLYSDAISKTQGAIDALDAAGYEPQLAGVLWLQGERDGLAINDATINQSTYQTALENMISRWRSDMSDSEMDFWIFEVGHYTSASIRGNQLVREAQRDVAQSDDNVWIVSDLQKSFAAGRQPDSVHYQQSALNEMGTVGATNVAYHMEA